MLDEMKTLDQNSAVVRIGDNTCVTPDGPWGMGWAGWTTQLTKIGWNEVILPFTADNTATIDWTAICSISFKLPSGASSWAINYDNLRASRDVNYKVDSFEDIAIIDDEAGEAYAWCDNVNHHVRVGSKAIKSTTLDQEGWITFAGFYGQDPMPAKDISALTNNGKRGALRFWLYVEDLGLIDEAKLAADMLGTPSLVKLGNAKAPDGSYFVWSNWLDQITKTGWNEIVLDFGNAGRETETDPDCTAIDTLYIKLCAGLPSTTLYIDDMKVSFDVERTPNYGDANGDGYINVLDLVKIKKAFAESAGFAIALDANNDGLFNADDLTAIRKYVVNNW